MTRSRAGMAAGTGHAARWCHAHWTPSDEVTEMAMQDPTPQAGQPSRSATTDDPIEVVREFLAALERLDIDRAVDLLDPSVVYQNVPFPAARGLGAVERQLRWLSRYGTAFEVRYDNVAANGAIVLTERTDVLTFGPVSAAFWVCGTFEVRDGRITLWRDRFDFLDVTWAFIRGAARALLDRAREAR